MTRINAAKSRYTSAIINAGTKVKRSVKYHIEDEFRTLFKTVNPKIAAKMILTISAVHYL